MFETIAKQRFGKLIAIKPTNQRKNRSIVWECKCDCGGTKLVSRGHLMVGGVKSCGCLLKETSVQALLDAAEKRKLPRGEASFNSILSGYKQSAKNRGHSFKLTRKQFKNLTQLNCFYCGCEPSREFKSNSGNFNGNYIYNGIDRMDNSKGYTLKNCVSCCWECNYMKRDINKKEFIARCKIIAENF